MLFVIGPNPLLNVDLEVLAMSKKSLILSDYAKLENVEGTVVFEEKIRTAAKPK